MRHLVIGQRQKAPNFSAFHWSPHGCLITTGLHFITMRVVHLPKRNETSLITESDQSRANHHLLQLCTVRTAWSDSDQALLAVHSCKSWLLVTTRLSPMYSNFQEVVLQEAQVKKFICFTNIENATQKLISRLIPWSHQDQDITTCNTEPWNGQ